MKATNFKSLKISSKKMISNSSWSPGFRSIKISRYPGFRGFQLHEEPPRYNLEFLKLITFLYIGTERIQVYWDKEHFSCKDCPYIHWHQHNHHFLVFSLVPSVYALWWHKTEWNWTVPISQITIAVVWTLCINAIRIFVTWTCLTLVNILIY